ncbi:hypothetical protein [Sphingomonas paucimobilis]|uniref:hypothetical protein n=1 Tax=Sphingomonas paucimobilis TaxID=13689 RepID=UPI0031E2EF9C
MTKPIKFRRPSNYDIAVAKNGVPFVHKDDEGNSFGTFHISLFNLESKFVRVILERFNRENKDVLEGMTDTDMRTIYSFINTSLHGWSNVLDENGKEVPFSREAAFELLCGEDADDIDFPKTLLEFAATKANFKHDPRVTKEDDAKN